MIRTQIQLPDNLYREVQRVARDQEWSIAEVISRGRNPLSVPTPRSNKKHPPDGNSRNRFDPRCLCMILKFFAISFVRMLTRFAE
jgi:hypothetical protein